MLFINHSVALGYTFITDSKAPFQDIVPSICHLLLATYLISLTASSITTTNVDEHWPIVIHISALISLSALAQCISLLLPNDGTVSISSSVHTFGRLVVQRLYRRGTDAFDGDDDDDDTNIFWYFSLALTFVAAAIATNMPRGPDRFFPPERVYTHKSIETAAKERGEQLGEENRLPTTRKEKNVCGLVASSVWGR
jgi:hypothetical protein